MVYKVYRISIGVIKKGDNVTNIVTIAYFNRSHKEKSVYPVYKTI